MASISDLPVRLARKITPANDNECWVWTGSRDHQGYGRCSIGNRDQRAHRVTYQILVGDPGVMLDHLCRNPSCVNPAHLEPVTNRVNQARGQGFVAANLAKTSCDNGHPYDAANTYFRAGSGRRDCRACGRERQRRCQQRRAAA